ncbi:MAG: protein kinase [Acidobacteriota bacterium]|nr:protein kinase [Acidobacteriota bacterium]
MADATKRRLGVSLGAKVFLISALLILVAVAGAIAVIFFRSTQIADRAVDRSLASSRSVQVDYQSQQVEVLQAISEAFSRNSTFMGYIVEATGGGLIGEASVDRGSILDLLEDRRQDLREDLRFDFAIVIDPYGQVVARTDDPGASGEDLSAQPLLAEAMVEGGYGSGLWREQGALYQAVVVPLVQVFDLYGYLLVADRIGDDLARDIKRISGTDIVFLTTLDEGFAVQASTLDAALSDRLVEALQSDPALLQRVLQEGQAEPDYELQLDGSRRAYVTPLRDAEGNTVGATVGLVSLDAELAGYRQIQREVLIAGGIALLLAMILSWLLSRRTLRPLRELASAAEGAAQGDYDRRIEGHGSDEVGRLSAAFDSLLSDLREKRDIEGYVQDLSRHLPGPGEKAPVVEPETMDVVLLGLELRRFAQPSLSRQPKATLDALAQELRRLASVVAAHRGKIDGVAGHRALVLFEGEGRALRAIAAASEIVRKLGAGRDAFEEAEPPAVAMTTGQVVVGSVVWGEAPSQAVVGLPMQQLEGLIREATPGDILISGALRRLLDDSFQQAGVQPAASAGILSTQQLFALSAEQAGKVAVPHAPTSALRTVTPEPSGRTLSELGPGAVLGGRFEILSVLGAGGMGVVYKARDRELDDLVAVKTLKPGPLVDRESLERLKSELKLARRITHPNVLRTFDFGEVDGIAFISMEYVRGLTLRYLLEQTGSLPYSAALRLARQLCAGLQAAHGVGVLHRDIKPENLIIDNAGNAKLMDFGIARPIQRSEPGQTAPGSVLGTPHYLSPEQLQGQEPDGRADIYSCGVVFYEMFTGELPFSGSSPMEIAVAHIREEPEPPSQHWAEIPPELEKLILRCLAKQPASRFPSAGQLLAGLQGLRA